MEYSPYAFIGAYLGIMAIMASSITIVVSAIGIAFLSVHREKVNGVLLWILRVLCWIALVVSAAYVFSSLYSVVAQLVLNLRKG